MSHITFILGGARSGKSRYAETLAKQCANGKPVLYIATGRAGDNEMADRIAHHRAGRPSHWRTIEEPMDVCGALKSESLLDDSIPADNLPPVVIIDCLTFYIVNHMLAQADAATSCNTDTWDTDAAESAVDRLAETLQMAVVPVIIVSNEVGMGLVPETPLGRAFRDCAGRANQRIAAAADRVILMVAGIPMVVKQ